MFSHPLGVSRSGPCQYTNQRPEVTRLTRGLLSCAGTLRVSSYEYCLVTLVRSTLLRSLRYAALLLRAVTVLLYQVLYVVSRAQ